MTCAKTLTNMKYGESAVITQLNSKEDIRRRLQDMGMIEGTRVECLGQSPLGNPTAYLIRGAVIALRNEDADSVLVEGTEKRIENAANSISWKRREANG